jgi:hypothetical protein
MSCYCNLPVRTVTCLSTGYKTYKCPRTTNDWHYKRKKWTVTKSKIQPCGFIKIKRKFVSTHRSINYTFKKWKKFTKKCQDDRNSRRIKKIDRKTPCRKLESLILRLAFIHKTQEGDALYVSKTALIGELRQCCQKYNYKWCNPKKETFQQFIEKLYKYFSVSIVFYKPQKEKNIKFSVFPKNTIDTMSGIVEKRYKFLDSISKIKPNPIDVLNKKLKEITIENKKYRMLTRREMKRRLKSN